MVHFVGGASVSGYKAYRNHTIARPGQWRMPRNYGGGSTRVVIKNYNNCSCNSSYGYGGFQLPSWMMWAQYGLGWANQLLGMFMPQPKQTDTPENPLEKQLKEMEDKNKELQKQIDELKKGNVDGKKTDTPAKPETPPTTEKPKPEVEGSPKVTTAPVTADDDAIISFSSQTTGAQEAKEGELETAEVSVTKGKRRADGKVDYQGWRTLQASYTDEEGNIIPFDFRNKFRTEVLGGKDIWNIGTQHFPKEFEYNGKTYTFNPETFATPIDTHTPTNNNSKGPTTGNTTQKRGQGTAAVAGKTTYSGSVTCTVNGEKVTVSVSGIESNAAQSKVNTKIALSDKLQSEHGVSKANADNIVSNARIKEE